MPTLATQIKNLLGEDLPSTIDRKRERNAIRLLAKELDKLNASTGALDSRTSGLKKYGGPKIPHPR